eukprot:jgi/Hompol1/5847/HPOL_004736-RA
MFIWVNTALCAASVLILVVFLLIEVPQVNFSLAFQTIMPDGSTSTAFLPFGFQGVINSMPFALYLYVGFEMLPVCAEETLDNKATTPRGMFSAMTTIGVLATATLLITSSVKQYTANIIAGSSFPHSDAISAIYGNDDTNINLGSTKLLAFANLIAELASIQSTIFTSSRYIYGLSRGGYLPTLLAITTRKENSPLIAFFAAGVLSIIICFPLKYTTGSANTVLAAVTAFVFVGYAFNMVVYIYLTQIRNRKNFNVVENAWGLIGAAYRLYLITFFVICAMGIAVVPYYFMFIKSNLKASPEKQ